VFGLILKYFSKNHTYFSYQKYLSPSPQLQNPQELLGASTEVFRNFGGVGDPCLIPASFDTVESEERQMKQY
jgi:hypothetical protein